MPIAARAAQHWHTLADRTRRFKNARNLEAALHYFATHYSAQSRTITRAWCHAHVIPPPPHATTAPPGMHPGGEWPTKEEAQREQRAAHHDDPHATSGEHHRGNQVDSLPAFVTPLISALLGAGGASAVIVALLNRKPDLIKARSAADGATVEQWRQLYKEARAEFERTKSEAERIQSSYYGLLGLFVQFRNDVRTGVSDVIVAIDKKDFDEAQQHAETLGRLVAGVKLPTEGKP